NTPLCTVAGGVVQLRCESPAPLRRQHQFPSVALPQGMPKAMFAQAVAIAGGGVEVPDALVPGLRHLRLRIAFAEYSVEVADRCSAIAQRGEGEARSCVDPGFGHFHG